MLAYLWLLATPLPWTGILLAAAVVASWRRRGLTLKPLGLGWGEFVDSWRRWSVVWVLGAAVLPILGGHGQLNLAALRHAVLPFAWAAAQQMVYQSMAYLPLRENLRSRGAAAGLAGVAFAVMHIPNPVLVPATYVWGVASSLLFEQCRSVWGLAFLQTVFSAALFWVTPMEWNHNFRIGPYY
jgi:hypothetical protein